MPSVIDEFDQMFNSLKRWSKGENMTISNDTLMIATATLMVFEIERRGWANRVEELQRAQRIAQAAKQAITKELGDYD